MFLQSVPVLYGSMTLFLTVVHNVFLLYYVDMFVSIYRIDKLSFWIGELIFLIWNSVNDPLFGWISDRALLQPSNKKSTHHNVVHSRLESLSRTGPLFAISFALFWIPWLPPAVQFTICLCLYDGFLTSVDLQHTALLADLAVHAKDRAKLNKWCSIFSVCGSVSVFLSYMFWNKQYIFKFQSFCMVLAFISVVGFLLTTQMLLRLYKSQHNFNHAYIGKDQHNYSVSTNESKSSTGLKKYVTQLASNHNFRYFASMNLLQVFHCHFNSNFFPLFLDALVGDAIAPGMGPFLIGISFVLPHINNIYFLGLCERHGVYLVIQWLFYVKLSLAVFMLLMGSNSVWLLCIFIASNRVFTEGTCKLLNLVVSDLVDEDCVRYKRDQAASAVLFGMSSLLAKPGQTLAPLVGTWLLAVYTGEDIFQTNSKKVADPGLTSGWMSKRDACFMILVAIPIFCSLLQLVAWSKFTLKGARLSEIKSVRLQMEDDYV
uniref:Transmembrane protein 180 n=1 Tax=Phallusia mammillata TaxID=59560 RepID=A0A6F9DUD4_9ASCI|nr:transmembrane protein 180 [Phallusia mammillata]